MPSSAQLVGLDAGGLAAKAMVGLSTVKDYEAGNRTPIANNLLAMQRALEKAGMTFTADSISGPLSGRSRRNLGICDTAPTQPSGSEIKPGKKWIDD